MSGGAQRSYWGVLPGELVQDKRLPIPAKYLYVILSSMAHKNGFCWPSNEDIASEIGLSKRRTVELLAMLRDAGYVKVVFRPYGKIERRYIYCGMFPDRAQEPVDDEPEEEEAECEELQDGVYADFIPPGEISHPSARNLAPTHAEYTFAIKEEKQREKQREHIDRPMKSETDKKRTKYELAEDAKPILNDYVGKDRELADAVRDMIANRIEQKAVNSKRAIKAMLSELDRLSGGSRANKLVLLSRAVASGWKTVYPMKPDELPDKLPPPGGGGTLPEPPGRPERSCRTEIINGEEVNVYD